jgi:hypothetical protein
VPNFEHSFVWCWNLDTSLVSRTSYLVSFQPHEKVSHNFCRFIWKTFPTWKKFKKADGKLFSVKDVYSYYYYMAWPRVLTLPRTWYERTEGSSGIALLGPILNVDWIGGQGHHSAANSKLLTSGILRSKYRPIEVGLENYQLKFCWD